jgi:Icc-related predicted phosphoesterase
MRIALASDLHLEFGDINLKNDGNADVLILSGDICTAKVFRSGQKKAKQDLVLDFFKRVAFQFPQIVYVMGNHEHYDYDIAWTQDTLKAQLAFPNLHILEKESVTINDVTFVGATLWTDMNKGDEVTIWQVASMMNDFRLIKNSNVMLKHKNNIYKIEDGKLIRGEDDQLVIERVDHYEKPSLWSPEQSYSVHKETLAYFNDTLKDTSKTYVVVGHHAPSPLSIAEKYKGDTVMNGAFQSDLSSFIMDRPQIKLWTHGHMHNVSDYMIGETRVVCNPRGYIGYESNANQFQLKYLEI